MTCCDCRFCIREGPPGKWRCAAPTVPRRDGQPALTCYARRLADQPCFEWKARKKSPEKT